MFFLCLSVNGSGLPTRLEVVLLYSVSDNIAETHELSYSANGDIDSGASMRRGNGH